MERRPDLKAEFVDPLVDALEEQARTKAYHSEALVMLQVGSVKVTKRVAQVKNWYRGMSVERI